jgi:hypothetical protein
MPTATTASAPLFPPHESREAGKPDTDRFRELHLYHGSKCNRACSFCTVSGEPGGWSMPFSRQVLDAALRWVAPDGNLKIYGGEPTLDLPALLEALRCLRAGGFTGWFTVFSNGVLAERVIALLEADDRCEVVLNYSILHGEGAEPLPPRSRALLEAYAATERPDGTVRLFAGHPDLVPVGRGAEEFAQLEGRSHFGERCPRCRPVLTARGQLHACPFAVEYNFPHYDLGDASTGTTDALARHAMFLAWIEEVLEPAASAGGKHPCTACTRWSGQAAVTCAARSCRGGA